MPAFVTGFSSNNPVSRGIRRGICCRCLPDACSASPIKLGEMRKTKLYQSCHASRPRSCHRSHRRRGITSACAEQTSASMCPATASWDHLRMCGADKGFLGKLSGEQGSPPRVRSRHLNRPLFSPIVGITSACAEQTTMRWRAPLPARDHLRVCGADIDLVIGVFGALGSPPRVRSRHLGKRLRSGCHGITSACAEQTLHC